MKTNPRIIISRTDNLGDVVLTFPMATLLKQQWPDSHISFLSRDYAADVINACPDVDAFISWDELQTLNKQDAAKKINHADIFIHVFPNKKIAKLAKAAAVKTRIGTTHRWYHWLTCNKRVDFTRKNSLLHEAQLNLQLLAPLELTSKMPLKDVSKLIFLNKITNTITTDYIDADKFNLLIHPLTNGNTKEWSLDNFSKLISELDKNKFNIIISGSKGELPRLQELISSHPDVKNCVGKLSLREFIALIGACDGIVVNSTGPLHIAAALGIHALGLFPPEKGKDATRWGPLGTKAQYIEAQLCKDCNKKQSTCTCMQNISVQHVKAIVESWIK